MLANLIGSPCHKRTTRLITNELEHDGQIVFYLNPPAHWIHWQPLVAASHDLKFCIHPLLDRQAGALTTAENLQAAPELRISYEYLVGRGCIKQLDNDNPAYLSILSRDVVGQIKAGDLSWSDHVPSEVAG